MDQQLSRSPKCLVLTVLKKGHILEYVPCTNDDDYRWGTVLAYRLTLPDALKKTRWKVKIRDKEIREPPHVTIIRGTDAWRIDLRSGDFMDDEPDPAEVPGELIELITEEAAWRHLCDEWDGMYPNNPVSEKEE